MGPVNIGGGDSVKNDYTRNAYMLIYEKRIKEKIKLVIDDEILANKEILL